MTRYEQGFLNKCAEYGLNAGVSVELLKKASLWGSIAAEADLARKTLPNVRKAIPEFGRRLVNDPGKALGRYFELLAGGKNKVRHGYVGETAREEVAKFMSSLRKALRAEKAGNVLSYLGNGFDAALSPEEVVDEAMKVYTTRLGTGLGAGGAAAGIAGISALSGGKGKKNGNSKLMEPTDRRKQ